MGIIIMLLYSELLFKVQPYNNDNLNFLEMLATFSAVICVDHYLFSASHFMEVYSI